MDKCFGKEYYESHQRLKCSYCAANLFEKNIQGKTGSLESSHACSTFEWILPIAWTGVMGKPQKEEERQCEKGAVSPRLKSWRR